MASEAYNNKERWSILPLKAMNDLVYDRLEKRCDCYCLGHPDSDPFSSSSSYYEYDYDCDDDYYYFNFDADANLIAKFRSCSCYVRYPNILRLKAPQTRTLNPSCKG